MSDVAVPKKKNGRWEVRWRDAADRRRGRTVDLKKDADKLVPRSGASSRSETWSTSSAA